VPAGLLPPVLMPPVLLPPVLLLHGLLFSFSPGLLLSALLPPVLLPHASCLRWRRTTPVEKKVKILVWWKENHKDFPTLSIFVKANAAFQSTSLSSERLFNKDKMLFKTNRKSLQEDRSEGFVFYNDYINRRMLPGLYVICSSCSQPPHEEARYRVCCPQHNQ